MRKTFLTGMAMVVAFSVTGCAQKKSAQTGSSEDVAALQSASAGAVGIPCGTNALTWKTYNVLWRAWATRTMLANYEQYGKHSEKWDDMARTFLPAYAKFLYPKFVPGGGDDTITNTLLQLSRKLMDEECSDPLLVYACGNVTAQLIGPDAAEPLVSRGLELLENSQYPRFYSFFAARRLHEVCYQAKKYFPKNVFESLELKKMQYLAQAAADADFANGNQRFYMHDCAPEINRKLPERCDVLVKGLETNPKMDPWCRDMVMGMIHVARAWKGRGSGYANTVTAEGWKIFAEELNLARTCFEEAHKLHPEFPEAAKNMIEVSMGSDSSQMRPWFNRAVAAQFDYLPAYEALRWGLRPRWCGSHEQIYAFGVECLKTKRFDTEVPWGFLAALREISSELDDWRDAYKSAATIQYLQLLFAGYEAVKTNSIPDLQSRHAILLWAAGGYVASAQLLDGLTNRISPSVCSDYSVKAGHVVADVHLRTGPFKASFARAESQFNLEQSLETLPTYQHIASNSTNDGFVSAFLKERIGVLALRRDLVAGKWVSLMPEKNSSDWLLEEGQRGHPGGAGTAIDLSGWLCKGGQWTVADEDGTLMGVSDQKGLELAWESLPGENFEITGQVEADFRAGLVFGNRQPGGSRLYFEIRPDHNDVRLANYSDITVTETPQKKLTRKNSFSVRVRGNRYTVIVNDETIFDGEEIHAKWGDVAPTRVGLGGSYSSVPNYKAKFRAMKIRRLPDENKPVAGKTEPVG